MEPRRQTAGCTHSGEPHGRPRDGAAAGAGNPAPRPGIDAPGEQIGDEFLRQRDLLTPEDLRGLDVDVVGAGALGGAILLCLAKMGFGLSNRLTVTDFDRCEPHNLPTQWFRSSDARLGQPKVDALAAMIGWVCDREIVPVQARFTGTEERRIGPVVILAVDTLAERRRLWNNLRRRQDIKLLVDARMGAVVLEIFCFDPRPSGPTAHPHAPGDRRPGGVQAAPHHDILFYEKSLEDPAGAFQEPCTHRGILYTVLGAAAFVGSLLRAHARGETHPRHLVFDFRNFFMELDGGGPG